MIPQFMSSCLLHCSGSECMCQKSSPDQYGHTGALPACLPVSLTDGLSQSLECLEDFKSLLVAPDFSFLLISLSCHIPGLSLHTLSLPYSFYRCSFCSPPPSLSLSLTLCPSLPGCLQPRGLTSWPGRRICQHIFSGLAVRNVRHRL